jgi:hypothetical protein
MEFFDKGLDYLKIIIVVFIPKQENVQDNLIKDLVAKLSKTVEILDQEEMRLLADENNLA